MDIVENRDTIIIRDGNSPKSQLISRLTGHVENEVIMSTKNQLYVYFKSSLGESKRGFKIKYVQGCKTTILKANGTIVSPSFGITRYPNNQECLYRIKNPKGEPLSLKFDNFDIDTSDSVQIFDGSNLSGLRLHSGDGFKGKTVPKITLTASSGEMLIRFVTDALHNGKGWRASYSADCPILNPSKGVLSSSRDTSFGTVMTFTCPIGQEFATGKNRITTECMNGGNWSIKYIPHCQEVYCGPVPQIDNGFAIDSTNVTYRGEATYQCYAGFAFSSNLPVEKISCLSDGRWEKSPNCLASQCPKLPEVLNANATVLNGGGRSYGTIIRYECHSGYVRSGYPVLLCMSNGTWSGSVPSCSS